MKFTKLLNIKLLLPIVILVTLASLRFINLSVDPVPIPTLHNEDEGNYSYNARNLALENKLVTDDTNFFFVAPLWTIIQYPFVKIIGIKFEAFRFPAALASLGLALLIFWFVKKVSGKTWLAFLGGALVLSNFLILAHSRIAMPETTTVFFVTAGFISWYFTLKNYPRINGYLSLLTGVLWSLAFFTKGNGISLGIVLTLGLVGTAFLKNKIPSPPNILKTGVPYLTFIVSFIATRVVFTKLYPSQFNLATLELTEKYRPLLRSQILNPSFWGEQIKNTINGGEACVWQFVPFLTVGVLFFLIVVILKARSKKLKILDVHVLSFLFGSIFWFSLINYKPARYFLLIVPALILCNLNLLIKPFSKLTKYVALGIVICTITFDVYLGINYIYTHHTFSDVTTSTKIHGVVKDKVSNGKSVGVWMLNAPYHVLNTYFLMQSKARFNDEDATSLINQYQKYGYPNLYLTDNSEAGKVLLNKGVGITKKESLITTVNGEQTTFLVYEIKK